jgi:hypothetical protein
LNDTYVNYDTLNYTDEVYHVEYSYTYDNSGYMITHVLIETNFTAMEDFDGYCIEDPARPGYFLAKTENTTGWGPDYGGTEDDRCYTYDGSMIGYYTDNFTNISCIGTDSYDECNGWLESYLTYDSYYTNITDRTWSGHTTCDACMDNCASCWSGDYCDICMDGFFMNWNHT